MPVIHTCVTNENSIPESNFKLEEPKYYKLNPNVKDPNLPQMDRVIAVERPIQFYEHKAPSNFKMKDFLLRFLNSYCYRVSRDVSTVVSICSMLMLAHFKSK